MGQQRDKSKKTTFSLEWQFQAGRSIRARTYEKPIWGYPHNFKRGKGVGAAARRRRERPFW